MSDCIAKSIAESQGEGVVKIEQNAFCGNEYDGNF